MITYGLHTATYKLHCVTNRKLHTDYIQITYNLHMNYICNIQITYKIHACYILRHSDYIQTTYITYELHTDYIQTTYNDIQITYGIHTNHICNICHDELHTNFI